MKLIEKVDGNLDTTGLHAMFQPKTKADHAFVDALESMSLALNSRGVSIDIINDSIEESVDAYFNNT